jgi:catechol 2,3-dioxygenase-like lactoylglutathione lyase family enzyme
MNPPPISGVSEIVLSVSDLPKMRDFYTQVLGFKIHSEVSLETAEPNPAGDPTITFLTICETPTPLSRGGHPQMLVLIDYQRHVHAKARFAGHDVTRSTLNHLAFEVPPQSFDEHIAHLKERNIESTTTEFPALSAKAVFFRDPEGNVLELICHVSPQ